MTQRSVLKLTAIAASVVLTIAALAMYRGSFAQETPADPKPESAHKTEQPIDSVAFNTGLEELQRIIDHYNSARIAVNGEIRYYNTDSSAGKPLERSAFSFAVDGSNTLYEIDSVITVTTPETALIIDKREESIAIAEKGEMQEQENTAVQPVGEMLNTMKQFIKEIKIEKNGTQNLLTLYFNEDMPANATEYVILYDAQSYAIKKLRLTMVDAQLSDELPDADEAKSKDDVTDDDELYMVDSANNAIPTGMYAKASTVVYEIVYNQERPLQNDAVSISQYVKKDQENYVPAGKYKNFSIL